MKRPRPSSLAGSAAMTQQGRAGSSSIRCSDRHPLVWPDHAVRIVQNTAATNAAQRVQYQASPASALAEQARALASTQTPNDTPIRYATSGTVKGEGARSYTTSYNRPPPSRDTPTTPRQSADQKWRSAG